MTTAAADWASRIIPFIVSTRWTAIGRASFPTAARPDVVHAWTPRENVRLFCEKLAGLLRRSRFSFISKTTRSSSSK